MCFDLMVVGVNIICFLYVFDALIMKFVFFFILIVITKSFVLHHGGN
ncbi:hypothetical protein LTSEMIN_1965 [Salmonella enterica subsp. enterica serovar Minnesota str. A4-603]|nr:hypothetical protein LTSEMIN_1965 [Salmonella enterica subsp. enterica serovar Minnesota str. A4-603]